MMVRRASPLARLAALLLLLASPGVGGVLLPAIHQCPAAAPTAAIATTFAYGTGDHHHGAQEHPGDGHQQGEDCHCIGGCVVPAALPTPEASVVGVPVSTPATPDRWAPVEIAAGTLRLTDRLPPSTAPPLV